MLTAQQPNSDYSWFVDGFRRDFNEFWVVPKLLGSNEVDSVFSEIRLAFPLVELEFVHGIENIPSYEFPLHRLLEGVTSNALLSGA